jgi:hypothetical protein
VREIEIHRQSFGQELQQASKSLCGIRMDNGNDCHNDYCCQSCRSDESMSDLFHGGGCYGQVYVVAVSGTATRAGAKYAIQFECQKCRKVWRETM